MDVIPTQFQIENRLAERAAQEGNIPGELDRDAFLQLLLTQLENQDPLSPMQDHEFVAQLATFSSLEQLENINEGLQASLLVDQSVNNSLVTNLIGKEVLADGSMVRLGESGEPSFQVELPAEANVTVILRNARGEEVRRLDAGTHAGGNSTIPWDGMTDEGTRAPAGDYSVELVAADADGNPVEGTLRVRATVTGVRFEAGAAFLVIEGQEVPLSSVLEVYARTDG